MHRSWEGVDLSLCKCDPADDVPCTHVLPVRRKPSRRFPVNDANDLVFFNHNVGATRQAKVSRRVPRASGGTTSPQSLPSMSQASAQPRAESGICAVTSGAAGLKRVAWEGENVTELLALECKEGRVQENAYVRLCDTGVSGMRKRIRAACVSKGVSFAVDRAILHADFVRSAAKFQGLDPSNAFLHTTHFSRPDSKY